MTIELHSMTPGEGLVSGGEVVQLVGAGFGEGVLVRFGDRPATVLLARQESGQSIVEVRTPPMPPGLIDVTVSNPHGQVIFSDAFRVRRASIVEESRLTRLVRTLLRKLKRDLLANTSLTVSVDFGVSFGVDDAEVITIAQLPALVLTGPRVIPNRFYSSNVPLEQVVEGASGPELRRRSPALTVDLGFELTGSSRSTAELLNLMAATLSFLNRSRWIEVEGLPGRWETDPRGEVRTALDGPDDLRAFTCGLVVRGFDVDEGLLVDLGGHALGSAPDLSIAPHTQEEVP